MPRPENVGELRARGTKLELFGCAWCEHTQEMREWLEFRGADFAEFDVEQDESARERMLQLSGGQRMVPVLVEDGAVVQIGWQGRGCVVGNLAGNVAGNPAGNVVGGLVNGGAGGDADDGADGTGGGGR